MLTPAMGSRRHACRQCGRLDEDGATISKRGLCEKCGTENMLMAVEAMKTKAGPVYRHFEHRHAEGLARYVQRIAAAEARRTGNGQ